MAVVVITLVLLQASLHSCRTYNTATPKNDNETSKPVKLPSKLIQILDSLDSPDAKITKIKELIPVYDDFPEFRVKSNKKHLFMPYQKKGKPLAYILKKTYVNKIVSDHTDESLDSFEDVKDNERIYKEKPTSYRNKVYFPSSQNEKNRKKHRQYEYPKINEIHIIVDGDVTDEPEINEYDPDNNNTEIKKSTEEIDDLNEPIIVLPAEHEHVHHTHRHNIEHSEEKAEIVSNSGKVPAVVSEAKHKESNHYHHEHNAQDLQLFQSEIKSDDTDSNRKQIPKHQKVTEDKPTDSTPKTDKIENALDQIQAINVHKHHHHPDPDVSIAAVAVTDDTQSPNIITTKHGHHKINPGEENVNPKHDLIHHIIAHHTDGLHDLINIDADELHADKIDSDLKHKTDKFNQELIGDTNATEQKSGEKQHPHSHHHSHRKENVKDLDKYLSYLNDLDLVSPRTNIDNDLNLSKDNVIDAILNDTSPGSKENNDYNAEDFNRIIPGRTLTNNQAALGGKLDSHTSDSSASEYYSDEFSLGKSGDASSSSEPSSEFIDSVSDSNQESTETDENSSTASSESDSTSVFSNELVTNDSNSYAESNSGLNSKSLEFDSLLPSGQSEFGPESNESDISGLEELPSEASNLISESVELSSESDSTNLSDESNFSQLNDNLLSFESPSSELGNSESIRSSEIGLNSISGSGHSNSGSEIDSKSDSSSISGSGYLSQSESEESSQMYSTAENISVSKKLVKESDKNQLNSTVILSPTILNESNSISASDLNSKELYLETTPTDLELASEVSYSSLDDNATSSEASLSRYEPSPSNLETVSESYPSNVETNPSSIENSALLETTALNSSSVATGESTNSSLLTASTVVTPVPDLDPIVSSLISSASSLKSVASNLESSALSLESVPGSESIASKLNTTAFELVYMALNLESTAMSLKWGSGLSIALNLMASSTESIVRPDLSTDSSATLGSISESKTSNLESIPSFSISRAIENSPSSPPKLGALYSTIQSSINSNVHGAMKTDCKDGPVVENKISNDKKGYSMSFVFNK